MADFDWAGTCAAIHATGSIKGVIAGDNQGNLFSSYPLSDDGNYKFWAFSDPYKATVMKNDGTEVEEDIYEAYNISLLLANQKGSIAEGHGIRLNGEKYMHLKVLNGETYVAKIKDADGNEAAYPVTIDQIHVLKKGSMGLMIGEKGGYFFACFADNADAKQQGPDALAAMAIGFYYCVGPDAA